MTPSDTIYVLTISHNTPGGDGNIYMCNYKTGDVEDGERDDYKFDMSMNIKDAKVFYSKQDAWNFREDVGRAQTWQITPMSALKVFTRKLANK